MSQQGWVSLGELGLPKLLCRQARLPEGGTLEVSWRRKQGPPSFIASARFGGSLAPENYREATVAAPCIAGLGLVCGAKPWGGGFEALQLADLRGNTSPSPQVTLQVWAPRGPALAQGGSPEVPCERQTLSGPSPQVKTYYCSYQLFISLQDPHSLEMQCPPRQKHYKPKVWDFDEALGSWRPCFHDAEVMWHCCNEVVTGDMSNGQGWHFPSLTFTQSTQHWKTASSPQTCHGQTR